MDNYKQPNKKHHPPNVGPQYQLARAYVPFQVMDKVYKPKEAMCKGTMFPELYMPYKEPK